MATNDFICDIAEKLQEDGVEYILVAVQKGSTSHAANAYYNIQTEEGADMIVATIDTVFQDVDQENEISIDPDDPFFGDDIE